jgi:outer membrane lipoprotein-sorting protein
MRGKLFLVVMLLVLSVGTAGAQQPGLDELRAKCAEASGAAGDRSGWRLTGTTQDHGVDEAYEMLFDAGMRSRTSASGPLSQLDVCDGKTCWTRGIAGIPHRITLEGRDINLLESLVLSGNWSVPRAPVQLEERVSQPGEIVLHITPIDGVVTGTLTLDGSTYLPRKLEYWTSSGTVTDTYDDFRRFGSRRFPAKLVSETGGQTSTTLITAAESCHVQDSQFKIPDGPTNPAQFDASVSDTVEVKRIGGYLFVRPKINGEEVGWFFLDTGADDMCLDPTLAKRLNLPTIGHEVTSGTVAVVNLSICRASSFQLGPATLRDVPFFTLDLASISQAFKIPIMGICGYDFIGRCALDIDPAAGTVRVLKPGSADLPDGAAWSHIQFSSNTPMLTCRYAPAHSGVFCLDTGSGSTVDFCSPTVQRYGLTADPKAPMAHTGGAGGSAESQTGMLDWFEIAGLRIRKPSVGLQLTRVGSFASPYFDGNVGMGFLGKFRLILDYANERIAFVHADHGG